MTAKFNFCGRNYISPSFKDAEAFLKFWDYRAKITEFKTTWIITHVEVAPSYGQLQGVDLSKVDFGEEREKAKSWLTEKEADKLLSEVRERS